MPKPNNNKGKRKGKSERRNEGSLQSSDDDSYNDNASIVSNYSDGGNKANDAKESNDELAQEQLEDKLCSLIEGMSQKSSQGRTNCLNNFGKALMNKFVPAFVKERLFTITDLIERSLKKGGSSERGAAADVATLLCVQLGSEDGCDEIVRTLCPVLLIVANDNSVAPAVRAKCCSALGNISFLSGGELGDILKLMQQLQNIFSGSYFKGDGSVPLVTTEVAGLHASAISAWTLLLTLMAPGNINSLLSSKSLPSLEQLSELLESAHLDVRLAAGEALAMIFELGRSDSEEFAEEFAHNITDTLKQLATDSQKFRAKKDRKQQRATFRDILQFIEDDLISEEKVKFGIEVLILDTWTRRKQYETLCDILGSGMNIHLAENELLRDIFSIEGPALQPSCVLQAYDRKSETANRQQLNAINRKARMISRAKNRDKRSDF